jgi:hypothetical protein
VLEAADRGGVEVGYRELGGELACLLVQVVEQELERVPEEPIVCGLAWSWVTR